ncbi:MAG: glycosyltransferase family 39 protein [Candidatus Brocadiia bacterium]
MIHERREFARDVAVIFVLALGIRLALALSLPPNDTVSWDQSYWEYARNFSGGRGFWMPNPYSDAVNLPRVYAFRPPLFPFAWGCVFRLTHGAYAPIRIAFAFLGAATCAIAYLAGIELTGKRIVAALAGILCAFYPPLVWHSVHLMTEPLFIFFSAGCMYAAFLFRHTGRLRWAALAGLAAGLAALSRSMLIGFLPLLAIWMWWARRRLGRGWSGAALFCAVALATLAPWIVRNAIVFREFVPTTTDAGHGFYAANNERSLDDPSGFYIPKDWSFMLKPGETSIGEVEASRRLMHIAGEYLLSHPGVALRLMARRFAALWKFYPNPDYVGRTQVLVYALAYIPLFPFILFGLWRAHRRREAEPMDLLLVDGLILYTTAIHTVFLAMLRYREPLMPFLLIFAAMGILCVVEGLRRESGRKDVSGKCPPGKGAPA